jgi:transposase
LKASEQQRPDVVAEREAFQKRLASVPAERFHFIDETGSTIAMTRTHARAPRGQRVVQHVPRQRGFVTTTVASLCIDGLEAVRTFLGGTSGPRFTAFVQQDLLPHLQRGDVVVWDGLGAHKALAVRALLEQAGVQIWQLPPYSPDLNPIEYVWSPIKSALRSLGARTHAALAQAIPRVCRAVSPAVAQAAIAHCGFGGARAPPP